METVKYITFYNKQILRFFWVLALVVFVHPIMAQPIRNGVSINNEKVYLTLNREIMDIELAGIVQHFDLQELPLKDWLNGQDLEKLSKFGWTLEKPDKQWFTISRPVESIGDLGELEKKILLASDHKPGSDLYPVGVFRKEAGFNRLRQPGAIVVKEGIATIFLEGYKNASEVKLAGSFTAWQSGALAMKRSAEGWYLSVPLMPGKHFYKFIADGNWITHRDNLLKENDGAGNINSVMYMPTHTFYLKDYAGASKVVVSGSFNGWAPDEAQMRKTAAGWELPFYLPEGTYTYRFIVNGKWMADPANPDKLANEFGESNSVLRLGKPYVFRLEGFQDAKQVILVGSFNDWRNQELKLTKRAGGWEIPYTLGPGNYEYFYLVDGDRLGPLPPKVKPAGNEPLNFDLVIAPNYTFALKGFSNASSVYLSGSFNNWSKAGFPMKFENGQWVLKMNLPAGKQTYKFVVDGKWVLDPANKLWEQNEQGTKNSVLWVEGI